MAYCINQSFSKALSASGAFNYQQRFQKETLFFFFFCGGAKRGFLLHPSQTPSAAPQSDVKAAKKTVYGFFYKIFFKTVVKLLSIFNWSL